MMLRVLGCRAPLPGLGRRCAGRRPPPLNEQDERLFSKSLRDRNVRESTHGEGRGAPWRAARASGAGAGWGTVDGRGSKDFLAGLSMRAGQGGAGGGRAYTPQQERYMSVMACTAAGLVSPMFVFPPFAACLWMMCYYPALYFLSRRLNLATFREGAMSPFLLLIPVGGALGLVVLATESVALAFVFFAGAAVAIFTDAKNITA